MKDTDTFITTSPSIQKILEAVKLNKSISLSNVHNGLKGFLSSAIFEAYDGNVLYVVPSERTAQKTAEDLRVLLGDHVYYYPCDPIHSYFADAYSKDAVGEQLKMIEAVTSGKKVLTVVAAETLLRKNPSFSGADDENVQSENTNNTHGFVKIAVGDERDYSEFVEMIARMGYLRVDQIEGAGQFAVRGDIIDLFCVTETKPWRIDFFGDEIERIRAFDIESQRSTDHIDTIVLAPVDTALLAGDAQNEVLVRINEKYEGHEHYAVLLESLKEQPEAHQMTLAAFSGKGETMMRFLNDPCLIMDDPEQIYAAAEHFSERAQSEFKNLIDQGAAFPEEWHLFLSVSEWSTQIKNAVSVMVYPFDCEDPSAKCVDFNIRSLESFAGRPELFKKYAEERLSVGWRLRLYCKNERTLTNIKQYINELAIEDPKLHEDSLTFALGEVSEGFEWPELSLCVIGENDIFKAQKEKRKRRHRIKGKKIDSFAQLKKGDYVVHDLHGIGIYRGIKQIEIDGIIKDLMVIEYSNDSFFYLSVEQMDTVQVYIGGKDESHKPKISTLGRPEWHKAKAKARKAVEDMADELIALYSKRLNARGYAFCEDTVWQNEFEEAFPYEETDDQLRCIDEIKADMEKPVPMDRLLCGDVGFGKTEVALRAAFKAIMDGKQVALLVPTTILAQQHYNTITERFKNYPIEIGLLNRFRSKKQQTQLTDDLAIGKTDLVVGTHRLLSKDVQFKDLGLLIIDEEQRFGVRHKEKLKTLKENVDVLTLSATPIPRTLHMSMTGVRDISTIEEPPAGRRPVQTYVMRYNPVILSDAIERELARGGQVFYVHNRVWDIEEVVGNVRRMAPDARVIAAHGQMTGSELEKIMLDFYNHEYDILVATTIIESGMDVPNVNTMIVDNGDTFGLSQLYQLRGRIGRSDRQGYCYITHRRENVSEIAQKRLKAIRDFTAFGSGFKVAMRDLEIRGSGNILGAEQSGHLFSIGYEMYCRILNETLENRLEGKKQTERADIPVKINLNASAYVPSDYIDSETIKYDIYRKLAYVRTEEDYDALEEELTERFGAVPLSVKNLMRISMIKYLAKALNISEIRQEMRIVKLIFHQDGDLPNFDPALIPSMYAKYGVKFKGARNQDRIWSITLKKKEPEGQLAEIIAFLREF